MIMELHGEIQNGQLILSAIQKELKKHYLTSMRDGTRIRITYTREGPMKTWKQVKTQFGLVVQMVRIRLEEMSVDVCGIPANKQMVYDILIKACGGVGDLGETIGLSEMTIEQASQFFENCRVWSATQLNLDIPDPNPNWRDEKCQNEEQSNKSTIE